MPPGIRYIRTISCNGCERGASLILEESTPTKRSSIHEDFIGGILRRMMHDRCTCDEIHPPVESAWGRALFEEET